ncbi:MAG: hypothetical protein Q4C01_04165 [Clostridia bacterium]|nr:hypothetical protein [Clostridia bacterium]
MKYCKKCGVLYSTDVCPKCGIIDPPPSEPIEAEPKQVRKNWIALVIGVPLMIAFIYLVLYFINS